MRNTFFQIAIDGPVGSGKSTVTRLMAEKLGYLYVDTGATYRVAALIGMRAGVDFGKEQELVQLLAKSSIGMRRPNEHEKDGRLITVLLNGEDVSWAIRTEEVSRLVPIVAAMPGVRKHMVVLQQTLASSQNVVMEGRDITYRVLPDAQLKIYLTASDEERARRRHDQLLNRGEVVPFEQVLTDLQRRDRQDMGRETDPLKIVEGVWVLDTTGLAIEEVVEVICRKVIELEGEFRV